jgi:hypothetical protein
MVWFCDMIPFRVRSLLLVGWAALALGPSPAAAQPAAISPVFQINTYTDGDQVWPAVASNGDGRFVVVWHSTWFYESRPTQDGDGMGLYAQIFDSSGERIGTEFRIHQTPSGDQDLPAVAMEKDGDFVVLWRSTDQDGNSWIFGRRFDRNGTPLGDEFLVGGIESEANEDRPAVALIDPDGAGGFVASWISYDREFDPHVYARRFDPAGAPLGDPFEVTVEDPPITSSTAVAANGEGFVVAYDSYRAYTGSPGGLLSRSFTASGDPAGAAMPLDVPERGRPSDPSAASRPDGGYLVAWEEYSVGIRGRFLDPSGAPQGLAFPISPPPPANEAENARIAVDAAGGFLVAWTQLDEFANDFGVYGQRFDASGARQGVEFRLDPPTAFPASFSGVATVSPNGDFVAVWQAGHPQKPAGPDGSSFGVYGRLFRLPPFGADPCLFRDGRLSCDTLRDGGASELDLDVPVQPGDVPLAGDLDGNRDGDKRDDLCLYRAGRFLCDTAHDGGVAETVIAFGGAPPDVPLLGDVNGDGRDDACVRRRRRFLCDTAHNGGTAEVQIQFGRLTDVPLLGDVDGDGDDEPCLYRGGTFLCDTAHDGRTAEVTVAFGLGVNLGDKPLLGDVDNDGDDDFCVFRANRFLCDTAHDGGAAEVEVPFGNPAALPVLGNLDGF